VSAASAPLALTAQLLVLSSISFGGFPTVLPDVRHFVVTTRGWMTDQDFSQFFAIAQSIPGPNMILMMGFVGWKVASGTASAARHGSRRYATASCR